MGKTRWWRIEFRLTGGGHLDRVVQHTVEADDIDEAKRIAGQRADREAKDGGWSMVQWWGSSLVAPPEVVDLTAAVVPGHEHRAGGPIGCHRCRDLTLDENDTCRKAGDDVLEAFRRGEIDEHDADYLLDVAYGEDMP